MNDIAGFKDQVINCRHLSSEQIEILALKIFRYQARFNQVYAKYLDYRNISPNRVESIDQIPFLPIEFFKNHEVISGNFEPEGVFTSSGTSGTSTSRHFVEDLDFYLQNAKQIFESVFGDLNNYVILALLPSYLEREGSSLIKMMEFFVQMSDSRSGFYLYNHQDLLDVVKEVDDKRVMVWGVTFALLELASKFEADLNRCVIVETGGMKGRGKEITKTEMITLLNTRLNYPQIWSEYGMTELLSQGYGKDGLIETPPQMRFLLRELNDPFTLENRKRVSGGINVMDLANIHSCSFIETQDIGRFDNGKVEILGRFDNSDLRGCNLLIAQ